MKIRPLHTDEQKYTYRQSTQIEGQTGSIGYLRGDFGSGKEFFSSWFDHRRDLKTDKFKSELDEVINALRSEEYGLLKSRTDMTQYAAKYPDSAFQGNYATEYGFRADTEKYSFLIRCNPARGDYNFYCYCYVREWLDRHMEKASRGIRFITPDYKEKFKIPDGDKIRITLRDGEQLLGGSTVGIRPADRTFESGHCPGMTNQVQSPYTGSFGRELGSLSRFGWLLLGAATGCHRFAFQDFFHPSDGSTEGRCSPLPDRIDSDVPRCI